MSADPDDTDHPTRTRPEALHASGESTLERPVSRPSLSEGREFGPYRILRLLGSGGMGEAYEVEHLATGRRLALKILADPDPAPSARERFLREGRLAASLNHPNSVYVFGTEEIEGRQSIAMEMVGGGTLKDRVRERGPLPPREAVDLILQVMEGLAAAAEVGILHRDIKPANCFLEVDGTAKIGDFGLSLSTLARERSKHQLTGSGTFLGTPAFASPEQLRGADIDLRSDIYSLGATLYYVLVGRPPFQNANLMELLTTIASVEPVAPHRLRDEIPRGLSRVVGRCLAKAAEHRPRDYAELRSLLQPFGTPTTSIHQEGLSLLSAVVDTGLVGIAVQGVRDWPHLLLEARFASALLLVFLPIALSGRSLGDRIVGVRIVDRSGAPLDLRQNLVAALGAALSALGVFGTRALDLPAPALFFLTIYGAVIRSGFVDRLIGIKRMLVSSRVRPAKQTVTTSEGARGALLGPYRVSAEEGGEEFAKGYDPVLSRCVWIRYSPPDQPIAPARRDLRRATRLRWINGGRTERGLWDAYEAPEGDCLSRRSRTLDWARSHRIVLKLAEEIMAGRADGTLPQALSEDRVFVNDTGQVKLLDGASPETRSDEPGYPSSNDRECLRFLAAVLRRLVAEPGASLLPRNSRCFLVEVESGSLRSVREAVPILTVLARGELASRMSILGSVTFLLFFAALLPFVDGVFTVGVGETDLSERRPMFPAWLAPWDLTAIGLMSAGSMYLLFLLATRWTYGSNVGALWPPRVLSASRAHEIAGPDGLPTSRWRVALRDLLVMAPMLSLCWVTLHTRSGVWLVPIGVGAAFFLVAFWNGLDPLGRLTSTRLIPTHQPFGDGASDRSATYEVLRETLERPEFKTLDGREEKVWSQVERAATKRPLFGIKW